MNSEVGSHARYNTVNSTSLTHQYKQTEQDRPPNPSPLTREPANAYESASLLFQNRPSIQHHYSYSFHYMHQETLPLKLQWSLEAVKWASRCVPGCRQVSRRVSKLLLHHELHVLIHLSLLDCIDHRRCHLHGFVPAPCRSQHFLKSQPVTASATSTMSRIPARWHHLSTSRVRPRKLCMSPNF
jgi:hypothetical protein